MTAQRIVFVPTNLPSSNEHIITKQDAVQLKKHVKDDTYMNFDRIYAHNW